MSRTTKALATLAAGLTLALTAPAVASAGLIDGSLNNLHAADKSNVIDVMVQSKLVDAGNNNANTRANGVSKRVIDGSLNNANALNDLTALSTNINSDTFH